MPYYDSLEEDVRRAEEILKAASAGGGTIPEEDNYAVHRLLESFVQELKTRNPIDFSALAQTIVERLASASSDDPAASAFVVNRLLAVSRGRLGATGQYDSGSPSGPSDSSGLLAALRIDRRQNRILMNFGKSISFLSMLPSEARAWASALTQSANELESTAVGGNRHGS
jgi:hypothetical protein